MKIAFFIIVSLTFSAASIFAQQREPYQYYGTDGDTTIYNSDEWSWGYSGNASRYHDGANHIGALRPIIIYPRFDSDIPVYVFVQGSGNISYYIPAFPDIQHRHLNQPPALYYYHPQNPRTHPYQRYPHHRKRPRK